MSPDKESSIDLRDTYQWIQERNLRWKLEPHELLPWLLRPCKVRLLLVTDGGLNFGSGGFGLRTFVKAIEASPYYVRYEITLAYRGKHPGGDGLLDGDSGIARRIPGFRFDDSDHFAADMYDEAWLFGISTGPPIADTELRALSQFMDGGGGLFATGDHGALGQAMGGQLPRARSMRLWDNTSANTNLDEVSMDYRRRNDTNRIGPTPASDFHDQSDDVPQEITPKTYSVKTGIWKAVFPHPLLCGPKGMIKVMPDHPHEGECVEPTDLSQSYTFDGETFQEYPAGTGGNPRPVPEVISTSTVLAGTTSGGKEATEPHSFGGICAYDGHRASVGRVVTDATWHHFVNVNLVGDPGLPPPWDQGFFATPAGQAHFETIKTYYRNLAVWLAPASRIACMRNRLVWWLVFKDRVVEAVVSSYEVNLTRLNYRLLRGIGRHARDVLGRTTSSCQSRQLAIDLIKLQKREKLIERLDPWWPWSSDDTEIDESWLELDSVLDSALGGAIVAVRDEFLETDPKKLERAEERLDEVIQTGVRTGLEKALEDVARATKEIAGLSRLSRGESSEPPTAS